MCNLITATCYYRLIRALWSDDYMERGVSLHGLNAVQQVLHRAGSVVAIPFCWIERGVTFLLKAPVASLWRRLDAYSCTFEKTLAAKIISVALFPALMIGTVLLALAMIEQGIRANSMIFTFFFFFSLGAICATLERLMPWSREWLKQEGSGTDLLLVLGSMIVQAAIAPLGIFLTAWLVELIHSEFSEATIRGFWPTSLHPLLQVFLLLVSKDFFRYWYHRWMHENAFMWRWHSVHHSSTRLYWFNGTRSHPIEAFISDIIWVVPFTLIQAPAEIIFVTLMVSLVIGRFQHSNIDVKLGPLEYVFSAPNNHRYHHAKTAAEGNTNYGGDIILWDHVFGTFYLPKDKRPSENIGVGFLPDYPQSWTGLMLAPFRIRMWQEKKRREKAWLAETAHLENASEGVSAMAPSSRDI